MCRGAQLEFQQFRMSYEAVKRRSNFMAHVGEKLRFRPICKLMGFHGRDQLIGGLGQQNKFLWCVAIPLNPSTVSCDLSNVPHQAFNGG